MRCKAHYNLLMQQQLVIITGASRGLGLAITQQLLSPQTQLLCLSRHSNSELALQAAHHGATLTQWEIDLTHSIAAAEQLQSWLAQFNADAFGSATLINNACMIPNIVPLHASEPLDTTAALRLGLETPMLLSAVFLQATRNWQITKKVLNISSGLGRRAMASQATYCAVKAGLDHFTRCMALDEALQAHGAKVCALAPGVIDTDMQIQLRSADAHLFPDQDNFSALKQNGLLTSSTEAAQQVVRYLQRSDFGDLPVADVRH
jgi:benzil reductase ((S)-benzoin forming)